ncbi:S9 family peptidase [Salmonella enterica subsp. enterica serovar Newport]|nr:S9 family peptidase [Salmonella enterica subsp. enterica serovar Newport]EBS2390921.1 S9 family peptidase [Salmonella enterica subsp. enterica serovar Newport]ECA8782496.1 S9 family peptidase [Salmonella enterica subsp. enterica serovar Newport]ECD2007376.1 S9 family peptidase [Salmonella enterica subsp. enterica serovar Newport]EHW5359584.1 S9 family peptidase [Salmonella enterica]
MKKTCSQALMCKLEQPFDEVALKWVEEQNHRTMTRFARGKRFLQTKEIIQKSLNEPSDIPFGEHYCGYVYHFWQDDAHPRGIWQRTSETSYLTAEPEWETVLDIDHLNNEEGADWCFQGASLLYPDYVRALVFLSTGGDACEIREFDLIRKIFVPEGFFLPESKSSVCWLSKDSLLLALDVGGDSVTSSGYPRCVYRWERGTSPLEARLLFSGDTTDIAVSAWYVHTPGFEKTVVECRHDFYKCCMYLLNSHDEPVYIDIPEDASCDFFKEWMLITLTSEWTVDGITWSPGALLAINFADFQCGMRNFTLLFTPDERTSLLDYSMTRDYLLLNLCRNVVCEVEIFRESQGRWLLVDVLTRPDAICVSAVAVDENSNRYEAVSYGFLQPYELGYGDLDEKRYSVIKHAPAYFDAGQYEVTRHTAVSADGTSVPYVQVAAKGMPLTGDNPVLLYGYGGFGESLMPEYLGPQGATWLANGGVYVQANIRGGGEFGPEWHQAALKQHRHRAYEDFAAVAADLVTRRITCREKLAARGGSNGGLLIGNMLTDYPVLFGALVCEFPLLDMCNYHRWSAGALWIAEFGDPDITEERDWLKRYSPFDKVSEGQQYPPVLFTTGTRDDRVSPAHARKMVARMHQLGYNNVWLYEEQSAGHSNIPDNSQVAFYDALIEEFLWQMLTKR